jgi:hypothetical protein
VDPPLWVLHPFSGMLTTVDLVAYVRIRNVGNGERVMTDTSCFFVRQVDVEVLDFIDIRGSSPELRTLRFNAGGWERSLVAGDEWLAFFARGSTGGAYVEWETWRLRVCDGRVAGGPVDSLQIRNGDSVRTAFDAIRGTVRRRPLGLFVAI